MRAPSLLALCLTLVLSYSAALETERIFAEDSSHSFLADGVLEREAADLSFAGPSNSSEKTVWETKQAPPGAPHPNGWGFAIRHLLGDEEWQLRVDDWNDCHVGRDLVRRDFVQRMKGRGILASDGANNADIH
mmetsp:Transcript_3431/g.8686  ORF Transcript_3431/g.8686 Transcript_3431/m.8686 type:complete len:133 (-) Transcript_3431:268-666(-)